MKNIDDYTLKTSKGTTKSFSGKTMKTARPQYVQRSIPSVVDGLKPGQRKILFCSFKKNFVKEEIVACFSGYVAYHSDYDDGQESIARTIIGMAQDFVGSNNINLLLPNGPFGTRCLGGKDHGRPRVIYTQLSPVTRLLFPEVDDILLEYLTEDGNSIEPIWYAPIIPMVLVNGTKGKGSVPSYNPFDVIANIRRLLNDEPVVAMHPWYKGFIGSIEKNTTGGSYTMSGNVEEVDERTFRITELPIRKWTQNYKDFLASVSAENHKNVDPFVEEFCDNSAADRVNLTVRVLEESLSAVKTEGFLKKLKLTTSVSTRNMLLLDSTGVIKKYETPEEILEEFFRVRLEIYKRRKEVVVHNLEKKMLKCENKCRFIQSVLERSIIVSNRKMADLPLELKTKGFTPFPKKENISEVAVAGLTNEYRESVVNSGDYDYLLRLPIISLVPEKMQELFAKREKHVREVEELKQETVKSLWMRELDALEAKLIEYEKTWEPYRKRIQHCACSNGLSKNYPEKKNQMTSKTASVEELMEVSTETEEVAEINKTRGKAATDEDVDDFELEEKKKKGANGEAAAKTPLAGTKRREPASEQSPDNKVRKLRASPFNEKSGSILGRTTKSEEGEESDGMSN